MARIPTVDRVMAALHKEGQRQAKIFLEPPLNQTRRKDPEASEKKLRRLLRKRKLSA